MIEFFSSLVIFFWSTWCVLSPSVRDGIVGKIIYSSIAFASLSICAAPVPEWSSHAGRMVVLHVAIAALAARHLFLKLCWLHVQQWINEAKKAKNANIERRG